MADITLLSMPDVGAVNVNGGSIQYITEDDAVYFVNTNRPTRNLAYRDELLQSKVNEVASAVNAARGTAATLDARLDVSLNDDGSIKPTAIPDITGLNSEIVTARNGQANLDARLDAMDAATAAVGTNANNALAAPHAQSNALADLVRYETPSGFLEFGAVIANEIGYYRYLSHEPSLFLSGMNGDWINSRNRITLASTGKYAAVAVINGYKIQVESQTESLFGERGVIELPAPPVTGTRQDMVIVESWKEEVNKSTGLLFPLGNVNYAISTFDGQALSNVQVGFTGSAYFTSGGSAYAVAAATASAAFIRNPANNIGVLENGNYFQIRYRIAVLSDALGSDYVEDPAAVHLSAKGYLFFAPQGQLASRPVAGTLTKATGVFSKQVGTNTALKTISDFGLHLGATYVTSNAAMAAISGVSYDGFVYAIPVCLVHRRNSTAWSLANFNGAATYVNNSSVSDRPDGLFCNIVDRRDVMDMRHKVFLGGDVNANLDLYFKKTQQAIADSNLRQDFDTLVAFDNDGNGSGTIASKIYGNVILESLGLGETVPDANVNTDITKTAVCNNGLKVGFNGARTIFSDAEQNEDFTVWIPDHSVSTIYGAEGTAAQDYTHTSKTFEVKLDQFLCNADITDTAVTASFLAGHTPSITWGNGSKVAHVITKTTVAGCDRWAIEVKQYGQAVIHITGSQAYFTGDVYRDSAGKDWVAMQSASGGSTMPVLPLYSTNDGSVLPLVGTTLTRQSGLGTSTINVHGSIASEYYQAGSDAFVGYSNAAHGTGATESIFATFKINYKRGSSCLPQLPYGADAVKGAKIWINGTATALSTSARVIGTKDSSTKTLGLSGIMNRTPFVQEGANYITSLGILHDGTNFRFYYSSATSNRIYYKHSSDLVTWSAPIEVLGPGVSGDFDVGGAITGAGTVIKDGATWKMWYTGCGLTPGLPTGIGYATSSDGINWTKYGTPGSRTPVLQGEYYYNNPRVIKDGSTYRMLFTAHPGNWPIRTKMATSADGISWTVTQTVAEFAGHSTSTGYFIKDGSLYRIGYFDDQAGTAYHQVSSDAVHWCTVATVPTEGMYEVHGIVKVDGVYYTAYNDGGLRFNVGILALSDPGHTGTSTTGVYTATSNIQVNFGFRANDTVILFYERLALQCFKAGVAGQYYTMLGGKLGVLNCGTGETSDNVHYRDFSSIFGITFDNGSQRGYSFGYRSNAGVTYLDEGVRLRESGVVMSDVDYSRMPQRPIMIGEYPNNYYRYGHKYVGELVCANTPEVYFTAPWMQNTVVEGGAAVNGYTSVGLLFLLELIANASGRSLILAGASCCLPGTMAAHAGYNEAAGMVSPIGKPLVQPSLK